MTRLPLSDSPVGLGAEQLSRRPRAPHISHMRRVRGRLPMYIFVSCMCPSVSVCEKPETEKKTADCEPGQPPRAVCTLVHGPHGRARRVREVWKKCAAWSCLTQRTVAKELLHCPCWGCAGGAWRWPRWGGAGGREGRPAPGALLTVSVLRVRVVARTRYGRLYGVGCSESRTVPPRAACV